MKNQFTNLLSPYQIGKLTVKNRFCVAPMAITGFTARGEFDENAVNYMVERAKGGFGLLFTGALFCDPEVDPFSPLNTLNPIYNSQNFVRSCIYMNERIHSYGAKSFAQLSIGLGRNYPGLKAPSETIVFFDPSQKSQALTTEEIKKKINSVIQGAAVAKAAGFDGVDVHALHWGYLLDQLAMSITNQRTDEYGGSLENRLRAAKEIIDGIKQVCGQDYPVTMRLGLKSFIKGLGFGQASLHGEDEAGRTLEEGLEICKLLESYGYDALSVDVGTYESFYQACPPMYMDKGHVLEFAAKAKKVVNIPILTSNRMDDPEMSEKAIADGMTDGVVLGRASLADPYYPRKIQMSKPEAIRPCIACNQGCIGKLLTTGACSCAVNPAAVRESYYGIERTTNPKKVAVIGGGVAGMEAAITLKARGHEVELYEKSGQLGGNLIPAGVHEFKKDVHRLNDWFKRELKELDVPVHLNTNVTMDMIENMYADAVILAVGSVPIMPNIEGINHAKSISSIEALTGDVELGNNIVVVGGGQVGCEMAVEYAAEGKNVTVVEGLDEILMAGYTLPMGNKAMLIDLIAHHKVDVKTGYLLTAVNDQGVVVTATKTGEKLEIPADSAVISCGFKSVSFDVQALYEKGFEVYEIGDGRRVGNIMTSIWDAYEIARTL